MEAHKQIQSCIITPKQKSLAGKKNVLNVFSPSLQFYTSPHSHYLSPLPKSNLVMPSQRVNLLGHGARCSRTENGSGQRGKWRLPHSLHREIGVYAQGQWLYHISDLPEVISFIECKNDFLRPSLKCQLRGNTDR